MPQKMNVVGNYSDFVIVFPHPGMKQKQTHVFCNWPFNAHRMKIHLQSGVVYMDQSDQTGKNAGDHPENAFKIIQQIGSITFFRKPIAIAEKILYHQK